MRLARVKKRNFGTQCCLGRKKDQCCTKYILMHLQGYKFHWDTIYSSLLDHEKKNLVGRARKR